MIHVNQQKSLQNCCTIANLAVKVSAVNLLNSWLVIYTHTHTHTYTYIYIYIYHDHDH